MSTRFDEMAAQRDPLYAATKPRGEFLLAVIADTGMARTARVGGLSGVVEFERRQRDSWLLKLAVRALRNQGEPYYQEAK